MDLIKTELMITFRPLNNFFAFLKNIGLIWTKE